MNERLKFFKKTALVILIMTLAVQAQAERPAPPENLRQTPLEFFTLFSEFELTGKNKLEIRRYLMNVRRNVGRDIPYFPEVKVDVFVTREETFFKYTQLPAHLRGLFDGRVHILLPSDAKDLTEFKATLRHEYVHSLLFAMTSGQMPSWLNEGFAVHQESRINRFKVGLIYEYVRKNGALPYRFAQLDQVLAQSKDDEDALRICYEMGYLFVDHLFSRYKRAEIRDFILALGKGQRFKEALEETFHLTIDKAEERLLERIQ